MTQRRKTTGKMGHATLSDLVENVMIPVGIKIGVTALLDQILGQTVLSVVIGILLVEVCQTIWREFCRKRR